MYYFFIFYNLKRLKSNSLPTVWSALSLSQQSTVSPDYSQSIKINLGPYNGGTIVPSIHCSIVLYWRWTDFKMYDLSGTQLRFSTASIIFFTIFLSRSCNGLSVKKGKFLLIRLRSMIHQAHTIAILSCRNFLFYEPAKGQSP